MVDCDPSPLGNVATSQPLLASLSMLLRPATHLTAVQEPARAEVQAVHVPLVTAAHAVQLVMSSSTADPYCPIGQAAQAVASENGCRLGCAMYVPGEQHPKRAVLVPKLSNALVIPGKDSHVPPQRVRVKPLLKNMFFIVVTALVFQLDTSELNAHA